MELYSTDINGKIVCGVPRGSSKFADHQTLMLYETFDRAYKDDSDFSQAYKEMNSAIEYATERARRGAIRCAISDLFGFEVKKIDIRDISTMGGIPRAVGFVVNGRGFSTDFKDLYFDENYNDLSDK